MSLQRKIEDNLDRAVDWTIALAVATPVIAAYGGIAYGLYLAAAAVLQRLPAADHYGDD